MGVKQLKPNLNKNKPWKSIIIETMKTYRKQLNTKENHLDMTQLSYPLRTLVCFSSTFDEVWGAQEQPKESKRKPLKM